jgi:RNA polymerase sigma factor (sigma-70 family)
VIDTATATAAAPTTEKSLDLDALMQANEGLIYWTAKRFGVGKPPFEDRIQACRIGMWRALLAYDPERGTLATVAVKAMVRRIYRVAKKEADVQRKTVLVDWRVMDSGSDRRLTELHATGLINAEIANVLASGCPTPEQECVSHDACDELAKYATKVVRKRTRHGAKWSASDVAALRNAGLSGAEIGRRFGVSRENIRQVLAKIRQERQKEGSE